MVQNLPKAKNARSKRFLEKRLPQVIEHPKKAIFIKGNNTGEVLYEFLKDIECLKKPDAVFFKRKNPILPFEDASSLEFYSQKTDCSLFMLASHSKKRPDNVVMGRTFNFCLLDMIEFELMNYEPSFFFEKVKRPVFGSKPCFVFSGELFEKNLDYTKAKNLILDFFRGRTAEFISLQGLEWVICVSASSELLYFRTYAIVLKKSGTRIPRVELELIGPNMDLKIRRTCFAPLALMKQALKKPKILNQPKKKSISNDDFGNKIARLHLEKQDFSKLQTRKMKGLKRKKKSDLNSIVSNEAHPSFKKLQTDS
ncbi:ribosome production factor 2 homolog [Zophobas morio]|jgi:ribosome production factor 2|uniref:ribosome production factor 2 homolog n=1 Tax=Zophobas morio TaxID=2755281 RepID=UPI003082C0A2